MPKVFNESTVPYVLRNRPVPQYSWHTTEKMDVFLGAKKVNMDIRALDPGAYSYPYHFHHNAEEIFVVLSGEMTLRTSEGLRVVRQGDVIFCETGAGSAHQMHNHSDAPCRYLDIVTRPDMDMAEYPDTGKVLVSTSDEMYRKGPAAEYFDDEENPARIWAGLKSID